MTLHGLYAITDAHLTPDPSLISQVEAALKGGARVIQYRDKSDDQSKRFRQASALVALCNRYQRPLLINDDPQLALDCGAEGIHLGQSDAGLEQARALLGPQAIIGITCHDSLALAKNAQRQGADYVAFGAFFASSSKPCAQSAPLALLQQAHDQLDIPIVAIGGISVDNAAQLISRGADMIAVIGDLFSAADIEQQAQRLASLYS